MMNVLILAGLAGLGLIFAFKDPIAQAAEDGVQAAEDEAQQVSDQVSDAVVPLTDSWTRFDDLFQQYGDQNGVDPNWLKAFALNESDLGRNASVARGLSSPDDVEGSKSSDGKSWGLMQVTLRTAQGLDPQATSEKLNNPEYSVGLAARYIAQLKKQFSQVDPRYTEWVVKSYNQGPGNTKLEIAGSIDGYAQAYWDRWQRNYNRVIGG